MNSQQGFDRVQQTREAARAEYEKKTKGLLFTKDFQTRQEALMHDRRATIGERIMAWILRRSWGEYVLFAVKEDGEPAYQRDCARELGIDKKRVSEAIAYYMKRGYLEDRPKLLYPIISPVLASPPADDEEKSGEYRTFLEEWKVTYSSDFEEEKVLRSRLKTLVKVRLSLYKKSRQQKQSAAASLLETEKIENETSPPPQPLSSSPAKTAEEEDCRTPYQKFKACYPAEHFDEPKAKPSFEKKTKTEKAHVLERLEVYLTCDRWKDDGGRWIPFASKWLESYDADPPPSLKKGVNGKRPSWEEIDAEIQAALAAEDRAIALRKSGGGR